MIRRKAFIFRIEIDIHAVTCPGAYLPQHNDIVLKVRTLSASATTLPAPPVFPLLYQETLIFRKTITCVSTLSELQDHLNNESVRIGLIQWPHQGDNPVIIAQFRTKLTNLLFPSLLNKEIITGADINLLMEPTNKFKGVIAPRVEASTKMIIEETTSTEPSCPKMRFVNPKMICSNSKLNSAASSDDSCRCKSVLHQSCCECKKNRQGVASRRHQNNQECRCLCDAVRSASLCKNCSICKGYSGYFELKSISRSKSCCNFRKCT